MSGSRLISSRIRTVDGIRKDTGKFFRASKHFDLKRDAMDWGREHSRKIGSEFVEHNKDGRISRKDSHGNDPCPPRDTR